MQVGEIMAKGQFRIEGIEDIKKGMYKLQKIPQKHVTSSARKGMNVVLKDARASAPVDEGYLKQGMKLKGERSAAKAKKVYQVVFDDRYNHI
ncbi:MAG TPA: HK97 gp10 family phage protein, partial [Sporosarcina psychrophila]|nr:HK97 gp10 family phage protein [Sporosarcina psychrophila]